jgi:aspartate/tyrosine/aromatic aminotransferase
MENYKLDILGMSEVRWDSFREITTQNGFTFLYSGYNADEGPVRHDGVGLLLSKIAKKSLIEWHPIS